MAVKNGDDVVIKVGSTLVNGTISNSYDLSVDMIDVTTKDSSGHKEYIAGEDDATVSVEGKFDPANTYGYEELHTAALAKAEVIILFGLNESGGVGYQFSALIQNLTLNGPKNEATAWTANIQRTGATTTVIFS